ncbi:hypothetical protein V0288_11050 [Pannus brasiliensis CCIBt3594]|uniref:Uncharacterized protein n=1 Tax=Pannus brasiliensis CCIBt3594 TaxID=1427578 RepID=A0AAW9QIM2_9CHRO
MKIYPFLAAIPFLCIAGASAPDSSRLDPRAFTGNISLTLKHGIWKLWEEKPTYQDITLDLSCDRGKCQPEVWGYAPKYNKEVDHRGNLISATLDNAWRLRLKMDIRSHPWSDEIREGTYAIELVPHNGELLGSYTAKVGGRELQNQVRGTISPAWPTPVTDHRSLQPGEHPRLIFRASEIESLREKARTPLGRDVLNRLNASLREKIYYDGYVPNGGYHATGYCFLALLNDDRQKADIAWEILEKTRANRGRRVLEQAPIVAGVALAYDLCYPLWGEDRRRELTKWLSIEAKKLLKGGSPKDGWNGDPASNWNARARGAAGLAALAILNEPLPEDKLYSPENSVIMAKRHIDRYFQRAIGSGGFGTEGDLYTTEPMILSVFPFLQAYKNVMGRDLVTGSPAEALIPNYLTRAVPKKGDLPIPAYGRHATYEGISLFAMASAILPDRSLPSVRWRLEGREKSLFNPYYPHIAPFILAGDRSNVPPANPSKTLDRVLADKTKGFYVFRDGWRDENDFVASIYLKQRRGGGWRFPDAGSIRIWGLGGEWATFSSGGGEREAENVVVLPNTRTWNRAKPMAFQSAENGSGVVTLKTESIRLDRGDKPAEISSIRSFAVDYSGASGAPGLFVLLDAFIGSLDEPEFRGRTWVMNTTGRVTIGGNGFTITDANGATLRGTFITPVSVRVTVEKTEKGERILARGEDDFLVVMTVQKGNPPGVKVSGTGQNTRINVGNQEISIDNGKIVLKKF